MKNQPLIKKLNKFRHDRDRQADKVASLSGQLYEIDKELNRLNAEVCTCDAIREIELRSELELLHRKRTACFRMIEEASDRLTSLDERLESKETQLRALTERYINACTSEVSESKRLADSLNAEADALLKKAKNKAKSLNNSANNVLASRNDGYKQLTDEEVERLANGFKSEATRQRLMIEAEAKMLRERAQRLIDAINENKATVLVTLKYNGGELAVETANREIKNGGV